MSKVFLYGGCVIRDAFEIVRGNDIELDTYVARQSLISAMSPPTPEIIEPTALKSEFQKRMVRGDQASDLLTKLRDRRHNIDLLVIDFNIERVGVHALPNGSYLTRSSEVKRAKIMPSPTPQHIPLGTDRHFELFKDASRNFYKELVRLGLERRTVIVNAPLAHVDNNDTRFETHLGKNIDDMRDQLSDLTSVLAKTGFNIVTLPQELAIGDVDHKWGRMPLHYTRPAQEWVANKIREWSSKNTLALLWPSVRGQIKHIFMSKRLS